MSGQAFERKIIHDCETQVVFCHRIKTRMSGFKNDNEPGDFIIAGKGKTLLLEAKSTQENSFPISMLRPNQYVGLLITEAYDTVYGGVLVEMRKFNKIYYIPILDIQDYLKKEIKSLDLTKLEKYGIVYKGKMIDMNELLESVGDRHNGTYKSNR